MTQLDQFGLPLSAERTLNRGNTGETDDTTPVEMIPAVSENQAVVINPNGITVSNITNKNLILTLRLDDGVNTFTLIEVAFLKGDTFTNDGEITLNAGESLEIVLDQVVATEAVWHVSYRDICLPD